jgi:chaperonin cofactor prefoldin
MKRNLIPVFGHPNLWRDPESGAIINKDSGKAQLKEKMQNLHNKYNKIENDVNEIKQTVNDLKNLLTNYFKENNNA